MSVGALALMQKRKGGGSSTKRDSKQTHNRFRSKAVSIQMGDECSDVNISQNSYSPISNIVNINFAHNAHSSNMKKSRSSVSKNQNLHSIKIY